MSAKFFTNQDNNSLITTKVLAEGINLHRSNLIVNYDVPWNATRLMQRIGRVNRIGSRAEQIYVYNFYPSAHAKSINDYFIGNSRLLKEPVKFVDQLFVDVLGRYDLS